MPYIRSTVRYTVFGHPGSVREARVGARLDAVPTTRDWAFAICAFLAQLREPTPVWQVVSVNGTELGMMLGDLYEWATEGELGGPSSVPAYTAPLMDWLAHRLSGEGRTGEQRGLERGAMTMAGPLPAGALMQILDEDQRPADDEPVWGRPIGVPVMAGTLGCKHPWTGDAAELMPAVADGSLTTAARLVAVGRHAVRGCLTFLNLRGLGQAPLCLRAALQLSWVSAARQWGTLGDDAALFLVDGPTQYQLTKGTLESLRSWSRWHGDDPSLPSPPSAVALMADIAEPVIDTVYGSVSNPYEPPRFQHAEPDSRIVKEREGVKNIGGFAALKDIQVFPGFSTREGGTGGRMHWSWPCAIRL